MMKAEWKVNSVVALTAVIVFANAYITSIVSSLWVDELITYWVSKDSFFDTIDRAIMFQGQSPFYYLIEWLFISYIGSEEWILRIPSLLFTIIGAYYLLRLSEHLWDVYVARFTTIVFLSGGPILFELKSARPYSMALCFGIMSVYYLCSWLRTGSFHNRLKYVLATMGTIYAHYLFGLILPVHVIGIILFRESRITSFREIVGSFAFISLFSLPGCLQLGLLRGKQELYSFAPLPTGVDLISSLVTLDILFGLVLALIACLVPFRKHRWSVFWKRKEFLFLLCWWLIPPLFIYCSSIITGHSLFLPRYFGAFFPALAVSVGVIIRYSMFRERWLLPFCVLSAGLILCQMNSPHPEEDWRLAVAAVSEDSRCQSKEVALWPGHIENRRVEWHRNEKKREYLKSPLSYYPLKQSVLLLPTSPSEFLNPAFLSRDEINELNNTDCLWVVARKALYGSQFGEDLIYQWMRENGFDLVEAKKFDRVTAMLFFRRNA